MESSFSEKLTFESEDSVGEYMTKTLEECNSKLHACKYSGGIDDVRLLTSSPNLQTNSGTTAVCVCIVDDLVVCANVGDSRCVATYSQQDKIHCFPLSIDQTPIRDVGLK